ncbi:MAG: glycosyltransferase family 2 protein [Candidatus Electronema sp. VV]
MCTPRYSIITVCLNAKDGLKKTLHSIEQQTFNNFEWIVIDGNSTDGTVELLRNHPRVNKLISEPDEGIYDAMNKGIAISSGEYLLFLNAGDWLFSKETLTDIEEYLITPIVIGNLVVVYPSGVVSLRKHEYYGINRKYIYNRTLPHQATFIKRDIFFKYGFYFKDFKIKGDHDFFARIAKKRVDFSCCKIFVSYYPLNGISYFLKQSEISEKELELVRKRNFSVYYRVNMKLRSRLLSCISKLKKHI